MQVCLHADTQTNDITKLEEFTEGRLKFVDDEDVIHTASGWLDDQDQEFLNSKIQALEEKNAGQVNICWRGLC